MTILEDMYRRRFSKDYRFRERMNQVLCTDFFQRYVPEDSVVLDIAAGYCGFINNIKAKEKIALELNSDIKDFANKDVRVIMSSSVDMSAIKDETVDVAYMSNLLEHLSKEDILKTIRETKRVLKKGGRFLILQPNIRYCYKEHWMFFDHITPIDDRGLSEILELNGFSVVECRPRFMPYSLVSRLPKSITLLRIYLRVPLIQRIFGKQAFIYAEKR